ncbi:MAG: outer membrane protein assembly factor BamB [Rhodocyclales bacterium]|nr:outer membrane protein assembly factor BamB [Rhodocyclales bacterium]
MRRFDACLIALATLIGGGCSTVEKLNPFGSSGPTVKPNELVSFQPTADVKSVWQASVGSAGSYSFSPAIVGESIYAAARDGALMRFDGGRQVWRVSAGQAISGGVGSDGKLVVVGTPKGEVLAFDAANGRELWKVRVSSEVLSAPTVADGLVVVRSGDARIFGFDATDGKRRWVYQRSTPALSLRTSVGVMLAGKFTLAGFPGGKLVAIANNNGAAVWEVTVALPKGSTELERVADVTSIPAVSGSTICAAAFQGRVACFESSSGNTLWSRDMSSSVGVDMDNRHVYVTDDKGAVHALDRNSGASVWKQDKLALRSVSRPLALGNLVAVADYQGYVHFLRREDGAFAARQATDGSAVRADPKAWGNGLLIQTANGSLHAIESR